MEKRFLHFPVLMLKDLYVNSVNFCNNVFDVGIFLYSKKLRGTEVKRYKDALKFLRITQYNIEVAIINAKSILNNMPCKYPIVGIERDMLFDYYKNTKDEFELLCLGAFLAIKSILGTKPYCKTNKALIHARMFGYSSMKDLPLKLTSLQERCKIRWHMDKILIELQMNWYLKIISSHHRGMYVTFDLSLDELAAVIVKDRQQTKIQQLRDAKQKALNRAEAQLITH
jgi:hypothetical protein